MSPPASTSEKSTVAPLPAKQPFWRRRKDSFPDITGKEEFDTELKNEPVELAKPIGFFELFRYSTKLDVTLDIIGIVGAICAGAAQPLMTVFFGNLAQSFVSYGVALQNLDSNNPTSVTNLDNAKNEFKSSAAKDASYLAYIGLAIFVCTYIYMTAWVYTGEVNAKRLREAYLKAVLRQDVAYFDKLGAGEVATRIQTDTHLVQQGISEKVPLSVSFVAAFITGFVIAYIRSWRLALAMSSMLPCIAITGALMNKFVSRYVQLSLKHVAEGGTVAEEVISTIRTAKAFGNQQILSDLYDQNVEKAVAADLKASMLHGVSFASFFFVIYSGYALAFSWGTTLVIRHEATVGIVINVIIAILIGSFSLVTLAPEMQAVVTGQGAAAKLFATINRVPTIDSASTAGKTLDKVEGTITFENVKFDYPSRPDVPILRDLSIRFPAGKSAALVGASGSGKSTIISLVERFYDPLDGKVKLDGVDLRDLNVKWLRRQIGLVSQEPTLFATTIRGNVSHGLIGSKWEHASEDEKFKLIKEACTKANADGFISKLPLGYDTMVGERGFLLSGGQKQRIAIARAIVSDPCILLLDEATSALDTQSEGIVQDALDKAAAGRTTITIAHRLSTIKDADQIYVMSAGAVLEQGSHNELLQIPDGAYARLVHAQKLRDATGNSRDDTKDTDSVDEKKDLEKEIREEVPLGRARRNTGQSQSSDALEKLKGSRGDRYEDKEYGMFYLFKRMGAIQKEVLHQYLYGSIFAILTGTVYPVFGILYALAITTFQSNDPHELRFKGDRNALWFFLIAIGSSIVIGFQNALFGRAAAHLTSRLRSMSFRAILRQDIEFFDQERNSAGSLTANLSDSPQKINGLAGITLGTIVQSVATIVTGSIAGLAYGWKLALVGMSVMPLLLSTGFVRLRVVVLKDQANKKEHEESAHVACEAASAVRTVASLTREDDCLETYSRSLQGPLVRSTRTALWSNAIYALTQATMFFVFALIFWFGSVLVVRGELGTTAFFVCLFSTTFGAIQAGNVFSFVPDISSAKSAATDIINLFDAKPDIDSEATDGKTPKNVQGQIRFDDVHFRYPTRPSVRVLRGLNLTIQPGTFVALVGASGCGKSTVIQLIERFYDPLAGKVVLDGQDISDLNVQEYRKEIALVSQEPTLYAGTIRFNILLGATKPHHEITQEEIDAACRDANILDFVQSLPKGFDTDVGGKGSQLSGGQKQRIAIARALLRNPKVLLLDEATSALDSGSEKVVQAALDQAAKGRTTIAIAHRLSTIQNADCIYFLKDGVVSEAGTHDQLIARRGGYFEYVQLQALTAN